MHGFDKSPDYHKDVSVSVYIDWHVSILSEIEILRDTGDILFDRILVDNLPVDISCNRASHS